MMKPFKKNEPLAVFVFSLISLFLFVFSTIVSVNIFNEWYGIIFGIIFMVLAIPFHVSGKKQPIFYVVSLIFNSIANGCSLSALYLTKAVETNYQNMFLALIPPIIILFSTYLLLILFKNSKKLTLVLMSVFSVAVLLISLVFWIIKGDFLFSFCFFSTLISLFFMCVFGITVNRDERSTLRDISFGSFGSFIILTVVVIFIITEGEVIDGLDFSDDRKKKSKK